MRIDQHRLLPAWSATRCVYLKRVVFGMHEDQRKRSNSSASAEFSCFVYLMSSLVFSSLWRTHTYTSRTFVCKKHTLLATFVLGFVAVTATCSFGFCWPVCPVQSCLCLSGDGCIKPQLNRFRRPISAKQRMCIWIVFTYGYFRLATKMGSIGRDL